MANKSEVTQIKKRDGRVMSFDESKIMSAIFKALRVTGKEDHNVAEKLADKVVKALNKKFDGHTVPTVEQIQDIVEAVLVKEGLVEAAKAYILYRDQHARIRDINKFIDSDDLIDQYLNRLDWRVKENSNMAYSLQGLNNHIASTISAHYWLNAIYSPEIRQAHSEGDLHIHDLQLLAAYCCGWDIKDLLVHGFTGVEGKVQSKPPKHFRSALGMIVNFLYTLQGEANGAQAFSSFDTYLAPFIRYDKLAYKQVKQGMQEFMFNMNIPTRVGFQTPFTNITMDLKPSGQLAEENVIIGGEVQKEKYKDFQEEIDMFNRAYADVNLEGDAKGRVFTFPIPTYNITKDLDWDNEKLDPVWEMTSKYGIPYFCLDQDTKVVTNSGAKKIKDVNLNDKVLNENGGFSHVLFKKRNLFSDSIRLQGDNFDIICSNNHKFLTTQGLKKTEQLSLDNKLLRLEEEVVLENGMRLNSCNSYFFELPSILSELAKEEFVCLKPNKRIKKMVSFNFIKNRFQTTLNKGVNIPKDLDEELMELMGIILGDGSIQKQGIRVVNADKEIISFVEKTAKNKFNLHVSIRRAGHSNICKEISFNSVILIKFLASIGFCGNTYTKRIPEICYWRNDKEIGALLRGLFDTDGSIGLNRRKDHIISITFSNKNLVNDVLVLLAKLGIIGKLDKRQCIHITGGRNVILFGELVGFRIKRKQDLLQKYTVKDTLRPSMGDKIYSREEAAKFGQHYKYKEQSFVRIKNEGAIPYLFVSDYKKELKETDIIKIEKLGGRRVMYDITVDSKKHLFVLENGIISHNSNYINSDMNPDDARSMCPLAGDEKVLTKSSRGRVVEYSTIRNIYEGSKKVKSDEYEIYSDGKFIKGKFNKFNNQKMLKVVLDNGHKIKMSESHLNFIKKEKGTKEQVLPGKKLEKGMYLPYSLNKHEGEGGNEDLGFFVGAYAGDGSFDRETSVIFSLEGEYKKELIDKLAEIAKEYFGAHSSVTRYKKTKLVTLKVHSRAAVGLCQDFISGKEKEKHYRARLFVMSEEFRQGVIAGHYATDGGNRHRIYTSSPKMVETLNMLAATLGTTTSIYKDEREGRFGIEPNYAVLIYQLNRKNYGKIWFKEKDRLWVKIKEIKKISGNTAYCFEVKRGKPMFTVGTTGILTHNCRLRLDNRELRKRGGGLFGANPLTGSIGVVTINLPRIGYLAKSEEDFFKRLDTLMELSRESLETKREVIEKFTNMGLYPYSKFYLGKIKETFGEYWKNHFNTIGLLGMNEALLNYMSKDITSEQGHKFAEKILDHMRERLVEFQMETDHLYNLEATPGEGTTYRFAKADKNKYADIIVANEKAYQEKDAAPYYTNSSQLPVGFTDDIFSALDLQDSLQIKYTGGTVLHGFLGEKLPSVKATKDLVKKIAENYTLPYYTLTPTFSVCPKHGYLAGEHHWCPKCDEEIGYIEEAVSSQIDAKQERLFAE